MTILIKDLDEVEAWKGASAPPIPIGRHMAEVENIEEQPAQTGSPQVIITWRAVSGPATGAQSREWLVILPQTYGKVKAFLQALKWELKPGEFAMPTTELIGRRAMIVVGQEQRDGRTFTRVIGHAQVEDSDIPADTAGLPGADHERLPF